MEKTTSYVYTNEVLFGFTLKSFKTSPSFQNSSISQIRKLLATFKTDFLDTYIVNFFNNNSVRKCPPLALYVELAAEEARMNFDKHDKPPEIIKFILTTASI